MKTCKKAAQIKGRKSQKSLLANEISSQKVEEKSEILLRRIKIVKHGGLLKKGFGSQILETPNVHCSNDLYINNIFKYELLCYLWYYYTLSMKIII